MSNDRDCSSRLLFGGTLGWTSQDWTSSDDRVRGGGSKSQFTIENGHAIFHGCLDIDTLGGAGFASQRTTGNDRCWDLSRFNGIELICCLGNSDDKTYTFILKDNLLPVSANGREQSTVSWEFDFSKGDAEVFSPEKDLWKISIPWNRLKPTYRGRPKDDADPLRKNAIKRMSIMMRSFFGTQQGNFQLDIAAISATAGLKSRQIVCLSSTGADHTSSTYSLDKADKIPEATSIGRFWGRLFCWKL